MICFCYRYRQRKIRCRFTYTTKQDLGSNSATLASPAAAEYPTLIEDGGDGRDPSPCTRTRRHLTPCAEIVGGGGGGGGICGNIRLPPPSLQHPPEFTTNAVVGSGGDGGENLLTDSEQNKITSTSLLGRERVTHRCSLDGCCAQRQRCGQEGGEGDQSPEKTDFLDRRCTAANMYDISLSGSPLGALRGPCCRAHPDCDIVGGGGGSGGGTTTNSGDWLKLRSNRTKRGSADIAPYYFQLDPSSPFLIHSDRRERMTHSDKVPPPVGMKASLENI